MWHNITCQPQFISHSSPARVRPCEKSEKQGKRSATWSPVLGAEWEIQPPQNVYRLKAKLPVRASCAYSRILISQCKTDVCRCSKINKTIVITNKPQRPWFMSASILGALLLWVCLHVRHKNREWFLGWNRERVGEDRLRQRPERRKKNFRNERMRETKRERWY